VTPLHQLPPILSLIKMSKIAVIYGSAVKTPTADLDFRGHKIRHSNLKLAWEKAKAKHKLEDNIKMPKIEAFAIVDEDYERIHDKHPDKTESFLRVYWNKKMTKPTLVDIFIRFSLFENNREQFFNALETECEKLLFLCTCKDLIIDNRGLTPEEHLQEITRAANENPKQSLLFALTEDKKLHRILAVPEIAIASNP
jgi:hypothetical protein